MTYSGAGRAGAHYASQTTGSDIAADRVVAGDVVDYLDLPLERYHWPTSNLAHGTIKVGIGLLLVDVWQRRSTAACSQ